MTATTAITATAVPMHSKLSDQMFNNHPLEKSQDTKIHHKNLFTFENFLYPYIRLPDSVYYNGHLDFQEKKNFFKTIYTIWYFVFSSASLIKREETATPLALILYIAQIQRWMLNEQVALFS